MESSFLQGQTLVLARCEEDGWILRTSRVLVQTNGDNPRSWQSIIREATGGKLDSDSSVHFSSDDVLFGFRHSNHCFFAYDIARQIPIGRNRVRDLSPFVLIGAKTDLHKPDLERLERLVRELDSRHNGVPTKELEEGLTHPNPAVPPLAKKLLEVRKE